MRRITMSRILIVFFTLALALPTAAQAQLTKNVEKAATKAKKGAPAKGQQKAPKAPDEASSKAKKAPK
jgi:hypothetical protein